MKDEMDPNFQELETRYIYCSNKDNSLNIQLLLTTLLSCTNRENQQGQIFNKSGI